MKIRKIWYVYAFFILIVAFGLYNRFRAAQIEASVEQSIQRLSKPVQFAPLEKPPALPTPQAAAPVDAKDARSSLMLVKRERDSFMSRHSLQALFPTGSATMIKKAENRETLYVSQRYGNYTFWISAYGNTTPNAIREDIIETFKLASDELRVPRVNLRSPFTMVATYEFDVGVSYFIVAVLQHPKTKRYLLVGFTSKRFNRVLEKVSNELFLSLKPS